MTSRWMGEYEVVRRLRSGGMATLYLARRHGAAGFSRLVALKVIHPHLIDQPAVIDMFVDEARICSQIAHANVVRVEEFGVIDGVHYLVMEYLDGCSIGELLQLFQGERRRLDPELVARVIMQVAGGLHAAHETVDSDGRPLDIIHRDISPSNILLSADGHAKLIDFGIAKARNRLSETQVGVSLKGKLNYVAPEQATRGPIDRRIDIFSLGVVFWEMLVGQPLFPDDTYLSLFNRLHRTEVAPPSTMNPAAPAILDSIVLAMLRHDPADRPPTAAEVRRRIACAVPGAANREAAELGKLAVEVRDKRAAQRTARDDGGSDSYVSFSPTPRSARRHAGQVRVDSEVRPASAPQGTAPTVSTAQPAWRRRPVQVGLASLFGVGVTVGLLVGRPAGGSVVRAHATAARERPVSPSVAAPPTRPPDPPTSAIAAAPAPSSAPPAPTSPVPVAISTPATPITAPAAIPAAAVTRREPSRAAIKSRPARRPAPEPTGEAGMLQPAPPARSTVVRTGTAPFSAMPFDDTDNGSTAGSAHTPRDRANAKKTPITPDFDN